MNRRAHVYKPKMRLWKKMLFILLGIATAGVVWFMLMKPSNDRDWSPDQAILSYADINGDTITVHNIRNFTYRSTTDYDPGYYDATYNLKDLKQISFIVEPFSKWVGPAHTFLSFEFANNKFLSISMEIRKEKGEAFSAVKGTLNQFEIMYIAADERDVIKLRSNYRKDKVFLYPIKASPEKAQLVLVHMLERMNKLRTEPEFYNTFFNNCTNNIAHHVNESVGDKLISWSSSFILPAHSDKYAFKLGLIDTTETDFEKVRAAHQINTLAEQYADSPDFSLKIRGR